MKIEEAKDLSSPLRHMKVLTKYTRTWYIEENSVVFSVLRCPRFPKQSGQNMWEYAVVLQANACRTVMVKAKGIVISVFN
jgi:hypothetical protein